MLAWAASAVALPSPPHHHAFHAKKEPQALSPMTTVLHQKTTFRKASMLSVMETKVYNCACRART